MAAVSSLLTLLLISTVVIRSVYCQYDLFYDENPLVKRNHITHEIKEQLENQIAEYLQTNGLDLHHNDRLSNCLQKEITVNLEDNEKEFRPSILKNIYCINRIDGKNECSSSKLKCTQKFEKVMIGWRNRGSGGPYCWETIEYNRPSGCQCSE